MIEIDLQDIGNTTPLFTPLQNHTVLKTIIAGVTPGHIYTDDLIHTTFAVAQFKHRVFLAGHPQESAAGELKRLILNEIRANCLAAGIPLMRLAVSDQDWLPILSDVLADHNPILTGYQVYQRQLNQKPENPDLPTDFSLRIVDQALVDSEFNGKNDLLEEMCSERKSVQAFLDHSFGIAAFKGSILAGWCLSEYNFQDRCEVGIATMPPYQRQGLAKAMTLAFLAQAYDRGIRTVLWDCNGSNIPSQKTALSAGFTLVEDQPVLILYFIDPD
jgi:predicted acetyltransferase